MSRTIIKIYPNKKIGELYIIPENVVDYVKIVFFSNSGFVEAIEKGVFTILSSEEIIERYSEHKLSDLLQYASICKYYESI